MSGLPEGSRLIGFEYREVLVAVVDTPQRDEPPGRGEWARQDVVVAQSSEAVPVGQVQAVAQRIARSA